MRIGRGSSGWQTKTCRCCRLGSDGGTNRPLRLADEVTDVPVLGTGE